MNIFIITTGAYVDYGIEKVFSNLKKAQEHCIKKSTAYTGYHIEIFELDKDIIQLEIFVAKITKDGAVMVTSAQTNKVYELVHFPHSLINTDNQPHIKGISLKSEEDAVLKAKQNVQLWGETNDGDDWG